jgi:hypothetical protein
MNHTAIAAKAHALNRSMNMLRKIKWRVLLLVSPEWYEKERGKRGNLRYLPAFDAT